MNMTYCAFENTLQDLKQCKNMLNEGGPESASEIHAAKKLLELCKRIVSDHGDEIDDLSPTGK